MTSPVTELEANLQAMLNLKPPGVSGSRINSATSLCVDNVQSESVLVQKMFTHFKKAPGTHKLGALYVVDSVTRRWLEHAKAEGQAINSAAKDGTFAAGVHRVTELMPVLMNDIIASAPETQKEKIKKLVDIWDKGQTFPAEMVLSFREKLTTPPPINESTTPKNSPPPELLASFGHKLSPKPEVKPEVKPEINSSAIMAALANIARQNTTSASAPTPAPSSSAAAPQTIAHTPMNIVSAASLYSAPPQQPTTPALGFPSTTPPVNMQSMPFGIPQQMAPQLPAGVATGNFMGALGALSGMPSTVPQPMAAAPNSGMPTLDANQQKLILLQTLMSQGVPIETITSVLQTMSAASGPTAAPNAGQAPFPGPVSHGSWPTMRPTESRDRGNGDGVRSPRYRGRSRSRSPGRGWAREGYGDYGSDSPGRGRERDARRGDYRQRSPDGRHGRSPSPARPIVRGEKMIEYDRSLPPGHIKVYSRTLFIGGVTCSESELRAIFARFGEVQTCIVNREKRHAFVKMVTRKDAAAAKDGMENSRNSEYQLRTRWGVGFGPRDCSDYATGISIIPIHKLTEADRKWMLTAEYGGSGGKAIEHGLVVEEPDIEIGAGVSSKAISRRMQTDKSGSLGPKSTRHKDEPQAETTDDVKWRRGRESRRDDASDRNTPSTPTLGFPFGLGALPNGMQSYSNNFAFPGSDMNQSS